MVRRDVDADMLNGGLNYKVNYYAEAKKQYVSV